MKLEFSIALHYKERTHSDERTRAPYGSRPQSYRWAKRQAARVSRRNGRVAVAEYDDLDLTLLDQLMWWIAYLQWLDYRVFIEDLRYLLRPDCDGPGYCPICDGEE